MIKGFLILGLILCVLNSLLSIEVNICQSIPKIFVPKSMEVQP